MVADWGVSDFGAGAPLVGAPWVGAPLVGVLLRGAAGELVVEEGGFGGGLVVGGAGGDVAGAGAQMGSRLFGFDRLLS